MAKGIIVGSVLLLGACAYGVDDGSGPGEIAPAASSEGSSEADPPSTKGSSIPDEPVPGDPSLRRDDPATAFVPLLKWGFESASADCNGWPLLGAASSIRAVPARSGYYSCKVCADGSSPELAVGQDLREVPPGHYVLSAFVRSRDNTAAPSEALARVEVIDAAGEVGMAVAPAIPVRGEWDRVQTVIEVPEGVRGVKISVGSPDAAASTCLFVDDVTFTRSQ